MRNMQICLIVVVCCHGNYVYLATGYTLMWTIIIQSTFHSESQRHICNSTLKVKHMYFGNMKYSKISAQVLLVAFDNWLLMDMQGNWHMIFHLFCINDVSHKRLADKIDLLRWNMYALIMCNVLKWDYVRIVFARVCS